MINKAFPIDFIRQIIEQRLLRNHIYNEYLVGGENQVNLFSFYEQLETQAEVDRYVERYRELTEQQNRMGLIANGVIVAPENPSITNLNQCTIIPLSFTCSFRCKLQDRDLVLESVNKVIEDLKGRKVDIAEFDNGKLFMVGTIANNSIGVPYIQIGDYIGDATTFGNTPNTFIPNKLTELSSKGINEMFVSGDTKYYYYEYQNKLKVAVYNTSANEWQEKVDDNTYDDVIFPPEHKSFKKYKVSISFDSIRCEEPRNLNGAEDVLVSFGGSATITNEKVLFGNDLTKVSIKPYKLITADGEQLLTSSEYYVEPLEQPSSNNADTQINRLMSNNFIANTHTDSLTLSLQYSFILDLSIPLLADIYKYARYGTQTTNMSPNVIFQIKEYISYWGNVDINTFNAKIIESIDMENTESDIMSMTIPFQIQGDNN